MQMFGKDENGGESPSVVVFCKDLGGPLIYPSKKSTKSCKLGTSYFFIELFYLENCNIQMQYELLKKISLEHGFILRVVFYYIFCYLV